MAVAMRMIMAKLINNSIMLLLAFTVLRATEISLKRIGNVGLFLIFLFFSSFIGITGTVKNQMKFVSPSTSVTIEN